MLLGFSFVFIFLYLWLLTGSLFLTVIGLTQIFMAFFSANLIYRYLWPTDQGFGYNYFNIFNVLSLFIILGVGVDNLFVYRDMWVSSRTETGYATLAGRKSHVYGHAARAMGVTSLTTSKGQSSADEFMTCTFCGQESMFLTNYFAIFLFPCFQN